MSALDNLTDVKSWTHETEDYDAGLPEVKEYDGEFSDVEQSAEELAALRAEIEQLKADLHQQTHETVGAEMERDELREQVAYANEMLWEFTENPKMEVGEGGQKVIEDYFRKYAALRGEA